MTVESAGPPRFLGNPLSLCPVLRPRQDRTRQAIAACRHGPRYVHGEGSRKIPAFEAQSHGLGTRCLRFARYSYPHPTQNSLPATGQALPDGTGYPQGSVERFPNCVLRFILLSQAFLAQGHPGLFARMSPVGSGWPLRASCVRRLITSHTSPTKLMLRHRRADAMPRCVRQTCGCLCICQAAR